MAQAVYTREVKAAAILDRQECVPVDDLPGLWNVMDSLTGSGRVYIASVSRCDCPDFTYRGRVCKHMTAVRRTEAELATYAASWDAAALPRQDRCPMCGDTLRVENAYIGGKGYRLFMVCAGEGCGHAQPA
jgi:hypothetical protein